MIMDRDVEIPIEKIRQRFIALAGITDVSLSQERAGPEVFLRFKVGRRAPLYQRVLAGIQQELPDEHPFYGRLVLVVDPTRDTLRSAEVELLRSLITRSLQITSNQAEQGPTVEFVPFRSGEHLRVAQQANHAILGRRGVGKSSLILTAHRRLLADGQIPVWVDLQAFHGRADARCVLEIVQEVFAEAQQLARRQYGVSDTAEMDDAMNLVDRRLRSLKGGASPETIRAIIPEVRRQARAFARRSGKRLFVFLDDAHLVHVDLQPLLFDFVYSILKGGAGWLKVAGVKNFLRLYDSSRRLGLQTPNDAQLVPLDLTLVDPSATKDHLTAILQRFLEECGLRRSKEIMPDRAVERLVWCCAGVPRDFLWLFDRSINFALQHHRKYVGVQDVNLAVGEFGQEKMAELEQDTSTQAQVIQDTLIRLREEVLDRHKSNSFLVRLDTQHPGYAALQKLVDLRLVHLIHPSITPGRSGERYEAYLLDYSFYTGLHRRHGLTEVKITANAPPKYAELRKLPRVDLEALVEAKLGRHARGTVGTP